ncbi:hypothetical protein [Nocardia puris]|uniref:Uncharacterized protein n=1 Tax=Nocardia puris TaxID=208602 RepID=A0A366CUF1_9NOCA|nr:hypothetical protein [Nocardia puris]RBO79943.1 hypothetical protein DFR74_12919 [Nocardia puris]
MGAQPFTDYAEGQDPREAFDRAVEDPRYTYGHGGYTGTIAEKDRFVIITHEPLNPEAAEALASELLARDDPRIEDKWGPAGAIPVRGGVRTVTAEFDGLEGCPNLEAVAKVLAPTVAPGESLVAGVTGQYELNAAHQPCRGTVHFTTVGADRLTGWLFVGWASS